MADLPPTKSQLAFLRNLGFRDGGSLTREQASAKIDELLEREKQAGVKLKCPACKGPLTKRPRRLSACPHCKVKIRDVEGKLYTQAQLEERDRKRDEAAEREWFRDARKETRDEVREAVRDDKQHRREFNEPLFAGFRIFVGPACQGAADRHGSYVPLEVAAANPELLPPYAGACREDSCECRTDMVSPRAPREKAPVGLKVFNADGTSYHAKRAGCAGGLLALAAAAATVLAAGYFTWN